MAVEAILSTQITNAVAIPRVPNASTTDQGEPVHSVAKVTMDAAASATSTYRLFRVRSGDRVVSLRYAQTIGTGGVGRDNDFGLYDIEGGAVVDVNCFADAITFASAVLAWTELLPADAGSNCTVANCEQKIWQLLGLTADPFKEYDVTITCNEANTTLAIDIGVQITVVR